MKCVLFCVFCSIIFGCVNKSSKSELKEFRALFNYKEGGKYYFLDCVTKDTVVYFVDDILYIGPSTTSNAVESISMSTNEETDSNSFSLYKEFSPPHLPYMDIDFNYVERLNGKRHWIAALYHPDRQFLKDNPGVTDKMIYAFPSNGPTDSLRINSKSEIFVNSYTGIQWVTNDRGDTILKRIEM